MEDSREGVEKDQAADGIHRRCKKNSPPDLLCKGKSFSISKKKILTFFNLLFKLKKINYIKKKLNKGKWKDMNQMLS